MLDKTSSMHGGRIQMRKSDGGTVGGSGIVFAGPATFLSGRMFNSMESIRNKFCSRLATLKMEIQSQMLYFYGVESSCYISGRYFKRYT